MRKFVVLGGGISGLSTAFHLLKRFPSCSITLLEASARVGGSIKTTRKSGFTCEEGPRSIRNTKYCKQLFEIIDELQLREESKRDEG